MKTQVFVLLAALAVIAQGCSSNPHKAEAIETHLDKSSDVGGKEKLGLKDGDMVVQKKVLMSEELRRLQYEVYELEDRVYGNRKYGSKGLYGKVKSCRKDVSAKENGGDGKLTYMEPVDRITDKEDDFKIGLDEKEKVVGVSEEFLKDRIERFRGYKNVLQKREDEYSEKYEICKAQLDAQKALVSDASGS